jgi:hypothetical protein
MNFAAIAGRVSMMALLIAERPHLLFQFQKCGQLFVGPNDESLSVVAMCIDTRKSFVHLALL